MNTELQQKLYDLCQKRSVFISEEEIKSIPNLSKVMTVYSEWISNDMGDDYDLYISSALNGERRYFLMHFSRDWLGGWSYNETTDWFEITEQEYTAIHSMKQN